MLDSIKLIIVDDHILVRLGVRAALSKDTRINIIGEAANATEFFNLIKKGKLPDVVLLDIVLPDTNGIEIARRVRSEYPEIKILMLSAETDEKYIMSLTEVGIEGFISKSSSLDNLSHAVSEVVEGRQYFGKDITQIMFDIYISKSNSTNKKTYHINFTDKEIEIIKLCGEGLLSKEIANRLNISPRTIETHKSRMFKKLGINNTRELVKYAIEKAIIRVNG